MADCFRAMLMALGLALGGVVPTLAQAEAQAPAQEKPFLITPPLQWEASLLGFRSAWVQTQTDLLNATGGIAFGMNPREVNAVLPVPVRGLDWTTLPLATEFPEDVRYFWFKLPGAKAPLEQSGATAPIARLNACAGGTSYVTFLFRTRGLFRISFRFAPDATCPSTADAATEVFARYVGLSRDLVLSMHYRNGPFEVVDLVDPAAGYLIPMRWQQRVR
ncbi:MAG: hypothetical protein AB7F35_14625 [Acetobacteraceae bacterium]